MIVPADQLRELLHDKWVEVVVDRDAPDAGREVWVRPTPGSRPAAHARVLESYWSESRQGYAVVLELIEPDFQLPEKRTTPDGPSLTVDQRRRLFDGHLAPLVFDVKPAFETGEKYVLSWSRERRLFDGEKVVIIPREALFWIEFTNIVRRPDSKSWEARFHATDRRQPVRHMRRVPVLGAPEPEITSNPTAAIDHVERHGPINWDGTKLLHLEDARHQYRELHADRDREQETRTLTYRIRVARARARAQGIDDSREVAAIREWIDALEARLGAA